jgi:hypothetical protein
MSLQHPAGMLTSAAPLSTTKSKLIALFMRTGTTYVPPSIRIGTDIAALDVGGGNGAFAFNFGGCSGGPADGEGNSFA